VGQVDQHAEPVHLAHDLAPERAQPTGRGDVGRRVGPGHVDVVRQGQVADAEPVQHPEDAQRVRDGVAALGAEQRGDPAAGEGGQHVVGAECELQVVRVAADHPVDEVDLLQRGGHRGVTLQRAGDVDRPELAADPAAPQPRQVGVRRRHGTRQVHPVQVGSEPGAQRPRQVVVAVDQRVPAQQGAGRGEVVGHPALRPSAWRTRGACRRATGTIS
jgi:hypothetical protein